MILDIYRCCELGFYCFPPSSIELADNLLLPSFDSFRHDLSISIALSDLDSAQHSNMAGQGYNHPATDSGVPAPAPAPPLTQLAIRVGGIDSGYLHSPASTLPDSTLLPAIFYSDFVARLDRRTLDGGQYSTFPRLCIGTLS